MTSEGRVRSRSRRLAAWLVTMIAPITGWFLRTEARLERYAEGWRP